MQLKCPHCSFGVSPENILAEATISWPELSWIYFCCHDCKKNYHVQVENGKMHSITFIGAPGPDYEINNTIVVENFTTRIDLGFVHCWLNKKHYEYPARS